MNRCQNASALGFANRFRKEERILNRSCFLKLSRQGKRVQNRLFILCYDDGPHCCTRIGITVTRKVGGAVQRNRIKRVCREVFRQAAFRYANAWDINIIAKRQAAAEGNRVLAEGLRRLFAMLR